jgi:hypothetical protein
VETWVNNTTEKAKIIHSQILAFMQEMQDEEIANGLLAQGITLDAVLKPWYDQLNELYSEELPIAHLKDTSDIVVRALGIDATHDAPMLSAVTFVADAVKKNLSLLSKSVSPLLKTLPTHKLPWVFNGYAPGSIIMGFSLQKPTDEMGKVYSGDLYETLSLTAQSIAFVPQFIDESSVNHAIACTITDPAIRDAVIIAAHNLSPRATMGLHTIEVGSRTGGFGELTAKSRQVLASEMKRPSLLSKKHGTFTGTLEAADLGAGRVVLRNIINATDVTAIRCLVPEKFKDVIKRGFGELATITGDYETDSNGKPRLFMVEHIEPAKHPQSAL